MKMKQNIRNHADTQETISPFLESMKNKPDGLLVPDGYFESLNSNIVDRINKEQNLSYSQNKIPSPGKPVVWAPIMVTAIAALLFIFFIPAKNEATSIINDDWTEIYLAYDASYAEEALIAESSLIDNEINNSESFAESLLLNTNYTPTDDEIADYLETQEIDTDILTND